MSLRALLRNGSPLTLLLSIACALFLSPRGWHPSPPISIAPLYIRSRQRFLRRPLFSYSYESLFSQTVYFQIHAKRPGYGVG
jgi:hypothetical protein